MTKATMAVSALSAAAACEQLLLAYARGKVRQDSIEWNDLDIAFELARDALPGRYAELIAELEALES